uniref:Uncharacterized protein n=1 Tax=Panagrolaimus davidi TaxID=227884 RepID=A0A914P924_9BILA
MSLIKLILITLFIILFIVEKTFAQQQQYYGIRPYRYGFEQSALSDPYGNGGTRSTWQDSIVLHLFG